MPSPWTEDDLIRVRAARLRGQRSVQWADRTVSYFTSEELRQLEHDIMRELDIPRVRQLLGVATKGL